jgi:hypothetical protein
MRTIEKMSPTSFHLWETDREAFYEKYLADEKPVKIPQTGAMAIGSAFDAYVKCALHWDLFGNDGNGEFELRSLFEKQVEDKEIHEWAWQAGGYAFNRYKGYGNYQELLDELLQSEEEPRFEFALRGKVGDVPCLGKPDMWYKRAVQVVLDWKVNGFCSTRAQSPKKFFKTCRDCWDEDRAKPTRGGGEAKPHKGYAEMDHHGHLIGSHFLEDVNKTWAEQICIYSWLLGVEVGDDNMIACIDQLLCKPTPDAEKCRWPLMRVAQHRCRISKEFQEDLYKRLQACWTQIQSGHIFDELSREESDARCAVLDMPTPTGDDDFWAECTTKEYRG